MQNLHLNGHPLVVSTVSNVCLLSRTPFLNPVIIVPSQGPVGKRNTRDVGQRMVFVVDDSSVGPIGKPADILVRDPRDDLFDDLFALTSHDHVDIRTTVEQVLDFLRCFVASDDRGDLTRQLGDEIADVLELGLPSDADAYQIDLGPDEPAEHLRVLVGPLVPKVEKRHLADQVLHARGDVLQAGRRENSHDDGRIPEIRIQSENVFILYHHLKIIQEKNRKCIGEKSSLITNDRKVDFHTDNC